MLYGLDAGGQFDGTPNNSRRNECIGKHARGGITDRSSNPKALLSPELARCGASSLLTHCFGLRVLASLLWYYDVGHDAPRAVPASVPVRCDGSFRRGYYASKILTKSSIENASPKSPPRRFYKFRLPCFAIANERHPLSIDISTAIRSPGCPSWPT